MTQQPHCPKCNSEYTYKDHNFWICSQCAHEWVPGDASLETNEFIVKDANGTLLKDGDSVIIIKDLKVKGSSTVVKVGTKVRNIKLVEKDHNIDCKIDGIGAMGLKSEFVKKSI